MLHLIEQSFVGGNIVDVIFAFMALECFALLAFSRVWDSRLKGFEILTLMLPGIFLLLALRAALRGAIWPIIAAWLLAALVAHLCDVGVRFKDRRPASSRSRD